MCAKKIIFGILPLAVVKMVIPYDEIIEERKAIPTNFNEKKQPAK